MPPTAGLLKTSLTHWPGVKAVLLLTYSTDCPRGASYTTTQGAGGQNADATDTTNHAAGAAKH